MHTRDWPSINNPAKSPFYSHEIQNIWNINGDLYDHLKIERIFETDFAKEVSKNMLNGQMKAFTFWSVTNNPFSFDNGFVLALYQTSNSSAVWLIGVSGNGKVEGATINK